MDFSPDILQQFNDAVKKSRSIIIISHKNPDPDTIGSNLALNLFLTGLGKNVSSVCCNPIPESCFFLGQSQSFTTPAQAASADLVICVDASSIGQLGLDETASVLLEKAYVITIDHHVTNTRYGDLNILVADAASTTLVIFHLLNTIGAQITKDIATCLLCGLYSDTGSFMHSNTSVSALEASAKLIKAGARRDLIIKNLYKSKSPRQLYLWGKIFSEAMLTRKDVLVSAVKKEDFESLQTDQQSLAGVIDYLNMVKGTKITALLTEDGNGQIKGSLRTKREDVDLTEIAKSLGGGGHTKASGFTVCGHLQKEIHWKIVP